MELNGSETWDDRFFHQNSNLEKDKSAAIKNVVQQSRHEEQLANNGLYANIFIHGVIILSTLIMIFLKVKLIILYRNNSSLQEPRITFSLFDFNINMIENKTSYSNFCIVDSDNTESGDQIGMDGYNETCAVKRECVDLNLNITSVTNYFDIKCSHFKEMKIMGIIVI